VFGIVNSNGDPDGVLVWGTVASDVHRVVAILPGGQRVPAALEAGPMPFTVWAVAAVDEPVRLEAFDRDGTLLDAR
jgi:hypothetical protein